MDEKSLLQDLDLIQWMPSIFKKTGGMEGKVEVFLYPNATEQYRLMGSRNTFVARPWTHQMHLNGLSVRMLWHELSHLFSAPFGGWL